SAAPTRFGQFNPLGNAGTSRSSAGGSSGGGTATDQSDKDDKQDKAQGAQPDTSSVGTTGFDATNARKKKKKNAPANARPPPLLSPAEAATARALQRGAPQLYRREVVLPEPGTTAVAPLVLVPVHRRPLPDVDPYAPIGVRVGSFLWLPA